MTDREIAQALTATTDTVRRARASFATCDAEDLAERDAALVVLRQAVALERMLERWISARACRAAFTEERGVTHGGR